MNLNDLHRRLSKKPGYRKAYGEIGEATRIGNYVALAREQEKMTRSELATAALVTPAEVKEIEEGEPRIDPESLSLVLEQLARPMRELGVDVSGMMRPGARERRLEAKRADRIAAAAAATSARTMPRDPQSGVLIPKGERGAEGVRSPRDGAEVRSAPRDGVIEGTTGKVAPKKG